GITNSLRSSRRTEETKRMKKSIPLSCLLVGLWLVARPGAAQDAAADRGKAYELYDEKRFAEAADAFQAYLQKNTDDAQATLDFAALLSQLNRHAEAATLLRHQEVIDAVGELEKQGTLSFPMAMQRLYAWQSLQQYAPALDRANQLAETYPNATDLALLRAELFAQLGRRREAVALWQQVERDHAGSPEAAQAGKRMQAAAVWDEEQKIYELARERKPREVVAAVAQLEQKGTVS